MENIVFRKALTEDSEEIWKIMLDAKERMRLRNSVQWQDGYPSPEDIAGDIGRGEGYVLSGVCGLLAYGAVMFGGEPAYETIEGAWLTDRPYVVVHRLAVSARMAGRGLGRRFMREVEELSRRKGIGSFRVDTNFDNAPMLYILKALGFVYCGEIRYGEDIRKAFEKIWTT